jgi:hypothetical protein
MHVPWMQRMEALLQLIEQKSTQRYPELHLDPSSMHLQKQHQHTCNGMKLLISRTDKGKKNLARQ